MVFPLIPIAMFGSGLFGGAGLGSMFGGGKKGSEYHAPHEYYAPTTTDIRTYTHAPQLQFAPVSSYMYQGSTYIIDSPGAQSKKDQISDMVSRPEQAGSWDFPTSVTQRPIHTPGDVSGVNLTHIAIIAAVGLAAYAFLGKKRK